MCVIVHKPKDIKLDKKVWAECFKMNGHGAGLSYVHENELIVDKGFFDFEELYAEIARLEEKELVVHFRVASAGDINLDNCHPFFFQSKTHPQFAWALSHNGTLVWRSTKEESDTSCFTQDLLWPHLDRDPWFLDSNSGIMFLKKMMERPSGIANKFVIMRHNFEENETKTYIINEWAGTKDLGCWFSNCSYRVIAPYVHGNWMRQAHSDIISAEEQEMLQSFMSEEDWTKYGYYLDPVTKKWTPNKLKKPIVINPIGEVQTEIAKQEQQKMLALNGSIQVPRDNETERRKAKELRMNQRLEHLSNKGKKVFRRMANDFSKATVKDHERLSQSDKVCNFREEVRWSSKEPEIVGNQMSDEELDRLIVDNFNKLDILPQCLKDALEESKIEEGAVTTVDFTKEHQQYND